MEPVEGELQGLDTGSSNLLALPEPCPSDSDNELLGIGGIKPKSSPIPRRRSSLSCSDDDSQPPPSSSRRVSFADAFGLSLVSVKQFDNRCRCDPADSSEVDLKNAKEYFVKLLFALPVTLEELLYRVQEQKVDLESLELVSGTTTLKGTVRVLNVCFDKLVYIRTSLDGWSSHFDLLAEHVPEARRGITDCFSFKVTLVPPFGQEGARVDFCIRYETPFGTFWANNSGHNYALFCHEKTKEQYDNERLAPKSCLKASRHSSITSTASDPEEIPEIIHNRGTAAVTEAASEEEQTREKHRNLKEESIRNCKRRSRRKAARTAKLQQYFTVRDEKDLEPTEKGTDDADEPVPAINEAPLNLSTPHTNVISLLAESNKTKGQKSVAASTEDERNQISTSETEKQEGDALPVIYPHLISAKFQTRGPKLDSVNSHKSGMDSQLLENIQDKDTASSQTVGFTNQRADKSVGKTVEKAWECFEKCAMEKIGSVTDINKSKHVENPLVENNQSSPPSAHQYTFETVVAPLYHQVFERMEKDRKTVKYGTSKADESAGKLGGSPRVDAYVWVDARTNPDISTKPGNDNDWHEAGKEAFRECLHGTKSANENALSVPDVQSDRFGHVRLRNAALPDSTANLSDANGSESNAAPALMDSEKLFSWEKPTTDQTEQTPERILLQRKRSNDTECLPDKRPPDIGYLLHTLQQERTCTYSPIFPTQAELDIAVVQSSKSEDGSVTQTQISIDSNETQDKGAQTSEQTLNTCVECLDQSYTPVPKSPLFHSDISANVTPKINQSEALTPFQDLKRSSIQPQIPASGGATDPHPHPNVQNTYETSLIQDTSNMWENSDRSHHVGSPMESNPTDGNDVDRCVDIENDNETIHTEILNISPEETAVDVGQINNNIEHNAFLPNLQDEVTGHNVNDVVVQDTGASNVGSNPDHPEGVLQEEGEKDVEENVQVKAPGVNGEEKRGDFLTANQSGDVQEMRRVETQLEEREKNRQENEEEFKLGTVELKVESYLTDDEGEEEVKKDDDEEVKMDDEEVKMDDEEVKKDDEEVKKDDEEVKKDDEEVKKDDEEVKMDNEVVNEDDEVVNEDDKVKMDDEVKNDDEEVKKDDEEVKEDDEVVNEDDKVKMDDEVKKDGEDKLFEPTRRNEVDCKNENVMSVATLQSISNNDSSVRDVHQHTGQEQQNICLEQTSDEAESKRTSVGGEDDVNNTVPFRCTAKEVGSNSGENVRRQRDQDHVTNDAIGVDIDALLEKQESDCLNEKSENMDDGASTESLTDDEMELYLFRIKNARQTGLTDVVSMEKRHSISRSWTISSPMPSISEYTDEDQLNAILEDLIPEQEIKTGRDARRRSDEQKEVTDLNLLWWREFFSSENMAKIMAYTLLFVVFLITAYICDFIACFGLYLIALYWLYFQVQREPLKGT